MIQSINKLHEELTCGLVDKLPCQSKLNRGIRHDLMSGGGWGFPIRRWNWSRFPE